VFPVAVPFEEYLGILHTCFFVDLAGPALLDRDKNRIVVVLEKASRATFRAPQLFISRHMISKFLIFYEVIIIQDAL